MEVSLDGFSTSTTYQTSRRSPGVQNSKTLLSSGVFNKEQDQTVISRAITEDG